MRLSVVVNKYILSEFLKRVEILVSKQKLLQISDVLLAGNNLAQQIDLTLPKRSNTCDFLSPFYIIYIILKNKFTVAAI